MSHRLDRSGQQFNDWTVLRYISGKFYLCRCKCGTERAINKDNLLRGNSRSCRPCAGRKVSAQWKLPHGEAAFNCLLKNYKNSAGYRGIAWELGDKDFKGFCSMNCHYCGMTPATMYRQADCNGEFIYNGVDRLDSNGPYSLANCVPCCKRCNYMKASLSIEEFKSHILKIASHITTAERQAVA